VGCRRQEKDCGPNARLALSWRSAVTKRNYVYLTRAYIIPHGGDRVIRLAERYGVIPTDGDRCRHVSRIGTGLSPRTGIGFVTKRNYVYLTRAYIIPRGGDRVIRVADRCGVIPTDGDRCWKCRGAPLATSGYGIMKSTGAPVAIHTKKRLALDPRGTSRPGALLRIRRGYEERIARSAWSYP